MFGVLSVKAPHAQGKGYLCSLGGVRSKDLLIVPDACITTIRIVKWLPNTNSVRGVMSVKWESTKCAKHKVNGVNVRYPKIHVHRYTLTPTNYNFIFLRFHRMALLCVP